MGALWPNDLDATYQDLSARSLFWRMGGRRLKNSWQVNTMSAQFSVGTLSTLSIFSKSTTPRCD
jgi:hypothetical protein